VRAKEAGVPTLVVDYKKGPTLPLEELPFDLEELAEEQRIFAGLGRKALKKVLARLALLEEEMLKGMEPFGPEVIVLAGFMRLLTPHFLNAFPLRVINIHPALLPAFPGTDGYGDTFRHGCSFGGITVHFVDPGEDTGPIIAQLTYPIYPDDSLEEIKRRGLALEHRLLPKVLEWYGLGQVTVEHTTEGPRIRIAAPDYEEFVRDAALSAFR
jgi:phosphoribosylglycinamide formyltransferase-1